MEKNITSRNDEAAYEKEYVNNLFTFWLSNLKSLVFFNGIDREELARVAYEAGVAAGKNL